MPKPPSHNGLIRSLWRPLQQDVQREVRLALQVAVLAAAGHTRADIARLTGAKQAQLRDAFDRLERVAPQVDRDDDYMRG